MVMVRVQAACALNGWAYGDTVDTKLTGELEGHIRAGRVLMLPDQDLDEPEVTV